MNVCEEVDVFNMTISDAVPRLKRAVRTFATKEQLLDMYRGQRDLTPGLNLAFWCGKNGVGFTTYNWMADQLAIIKDINQERTA